MSGFEISPKTEIPELLCRVSTNKLSTLETTRAVSESIVQKGKLIADQINKELTSQVLPDRYKIKQLKEKWQLTCPEFISIVKLNQSFNYRAMIGDAEVVITINNWSIPKSKHPCEAFISFKDARGWPISRQIHVSDIQGYEPLAYFKQSPFDD